MLFCTNTGVDDTILKLLLFNVGFFPLFLIYSCIAQTQWLSSVCGFKLGISAGAELPNSFNQPVKSWVLGEDEEIMSHTSPQLDRKAPRAEPEEDIDVLRPGAEDALLENRTSSETEKSARITLDAESLAEEKMADLKQVAQILEALKHQEDSEEFINPVIPYLQDEGAEQTGDLETNKEPQKRLPSDSQNILEQPQIPPLLETEQDVTLEEVAGDNMTKWENSQVSEVSQYSPFTESYMDDACASAPLPAVPPDKQQEELFSQSRCERAVGGANQEATQQVCSQSTPPMSRVAMELSNQGGEGSQGCVLALTERHNRAGERREGKSEQTGGEEGQKDGAPETEGKQDREGLIKPAERGTQLVSSRGIRMESDSSDDSQSDSGVSTDSPCNTLEGNTTLSAGTPPVPLKETPIEREIRRSIEREHSLRRSRGLPSLPTEPEYVEIPLRKAVLSQSIITKSEKYQDKDKQYAGKKMQLEIHEAVQREQDLVRLGKVPGFYDKGLTQELKDRKVIFETFQKPDDSSVTVAKSKALSSSDSLNTAVSSSAAGSISVYRSKSASWVPQGQGFPDTCQDVTEEKTLALSVQILRQPTPEPELITEVDFGYPNASSKGERHDEIKKMEQDQRAAGVELSPRENPFFKLRSSNLALRVEQDIREAQDREQELYRQRISLYGSKEGAKAGGGPEDASEKKRFIVSPTRPSTEGECTRGVICLSYTANVFMWIFYSVFLNDCA